MLRWKLGLSLIPIIVAFSIQPALPPVSADSGFTLTILHNNDAASQLIPIDAIQRIALGEALSVEDIKDGVAESKTLVDSEVSAATGHRQQAIVLSGGNTMGAGPILQASNQAGSPEFDAIAMRLIGYDAAVLGARDFEDGPEQLAAFLCGLVLHGGGFDYPGCGATGRPAFPFLAANLDFSGEPLLDEFVQTGGIAASTIVNKGGHRIGVIGITNTQLHVVSSPGNVGVDANVVKRAQVEADRLAAQGVNKIILLANLDTEDAVRELATQTEGIDVVVTGAAGGVLPHVGYPEYLDAKDGIRVPILVTPGGYQYLGKLVVDFDDEGNIVRIDPGSELNAVGDSERGDLRPYPILQTAVERPVLSFLHQLSVRVVARTEVPLDGRVSIIESRETNLGDLMADAILWQAGEKASEAGLPQPDIAIINGGAIRLERLKEPGDITSLETYQIAPFPTFVSLVEDVTAESLKQAMENAVSQLPAISGRFAHVSGMTVTYDHEAGIGSRIVSIELADGTRIVENGNVVQAAPNLTVATFDFLVRGGDDYEFGGQATNLAVSYQQALESYLRDALGGVISAAQYPVAGTGRLIAVR